ncbi:MAG: hypothetical protein AB7O26_16595 [Planctomycetaceae bacterium]
MRSLNKMLVSAAIVAGVLLFTVASAAAKPIEAVKGKEYRLTKKHGPWMVMVASFHEPPPDRKGEGISPEEAAQQLVHELRTKGIPAYTFSQEDVVDEIPTGSSRDPQKMKMGSYIAQKGSISVLAGNYPSPDDKKAIRTRDFIKKFTPELLGDEEATGRGGVLHKLKNGGIYRTTPGRPSPLAGAFLTVNPLLSVEEVKSIRRDPLLLQWNQGEHSLLQNKKKYTLVVASFYGHSKVGNSLSSAEDLEFKIDKSHMEQVGYSAWELATALRKAKSLGYEKDYEAYVYHDRFGSVVTVGGFDSPDDPQITKLQNHFGAKIAAVNPDGTSALGAEAFSLPRRPAKGQKAQSWIFDPYPKLMEVPKFN